MPKGLANNLKIDLWPPRNPILEVLRGSARGKILDYFLIEQKITKKQKKKVNQASLSNFWGQPLGGSHFQSSSRII